VFVICLLDRAVTGTTVQIQHLATKPLGPSARIIELMLARPRPHSPS
jgi:hypothetical protein